MKFFSIFLLNLHLLIFVASCKSPQLIKLIYPDWGIITQSNNFYLIVENLNQQSEIVLTLESSNYLSNPLEFSFSESEKPYIICNKTKIGNVSSLSEKQIKNQLKSYENQALIYIKCKTTPIIDQNDNIMNILSQTYSVSVRENGKIVSSLNSSYYLYQQEFVLLFNEINQTNFVVSSNQNISFNLKGNNSHFYKFHPRIYLDSVTEYNQHFIRIGEIVAFNESLLVATFSSTFSGKYKIKIELANQNQSIAHIYNHTQWINIELKKSKFHGFKQQLKNFTSNIQIFSKIKAPKINDETVEAIINLFLIDFTQNIMPVIQWLLIISALFLTFTVPNFITRNQVVSKKNVYKISKYPNYQTLIVQEIVKFFYNLPNFITFFIGTIQFYATFSYQTYTIRNEDILKILVIIQLLICLIVVMFWKKKKYRILIIILILIEFMLIIFSLIIKSRKMAFYYWLIKANYINLVVAGLSFSFGLIRVLIHQKKSLELERKWNCRKILAKGIPDAEKFWWTRFDKLKKNYLVELGFGDYTPCEVEILKIKTINKQQEGLSNHLKCYINVREKTGENISEGFSVGDRLPGHRQLTRQDTVIECKVKKLIDCTCGQDITVPKFLDRAISVIDFAALVMLALIAVSISSSAVNLELRYSRDGSIGAELSVERLFWHLIATVIAANIIIPSIRMTLLYLSYVFLLIAAFPGVKINKYDAMEDIVKGNQISFDKTGTLTKEEMLVAQTYIQQQSNNLEQIKTKLGWNLNEIVFGLTMGNSLTTVNKGKNGEIWGMSPEENEIVRYWVQNGVQLLQNPLEGESGEVQFKLNSNSITRRVQILDRSSYSFGIGKTCHIRLHSQEKENPSVDLFVRQTGTSFIQSESSKESQLYQWLDSINDHRRSMCIAFANNKGMELDIACVYTFENPIRSNARTVVKFCYQIGKTPSILTGDSREAAEDLAKQIGMKIKKIIRPDLQQEEKLPNINELENCAISVEGKALEKWMKNNPEWTQALLANPLITKIYSRSSPLHKQLIASQTPYSIHVGDAENDALALKLSTTGVCMEHGAHLSKLNSKLIIKDLYDLKAILIVNGYSDMLIQGGKRILKDVAWLAGLLAGILAIGIHSIQFQLLPSGVPLYKDVWNGLPMLVLSSAQYTVSVIAYASSDCSHQQLQKQKYTTLKAIFNLVLGLGFGLVLGAIVKIWLPSHDYGFTILHYVDLIILIKHSIHCIIRPSEGAARKENGLFGNQFIGKESSWVLMALAIADSIPFRILLFCLFCILPIWK